MVETLSVFVAAFLVGVFVERALIWAQVKNARLEARREQARADKAIDMFLGLKGGYPVSDFTQEEVVKPKQEITEKIRREMNEYFATEIGGDHGKVSDNPVPDE